MTDLDKAITEAKAFISEYRYEAGDELSFYDALILNAAASGELIPKAGAKLAAAEAYQRAAGAAYDWLTSTDPAIQQARIDAAIAFLETDSDKPAEQVRDAILARAALKGADHE